MVVILAAVGALFTACKKDDGTTVKLLNPTILFNNSMSSAPSCNNASPVISKDTTVQPNTTVSFQVVFTKGTDGKSLNKIFPTVQTSGSGGFNKINQSFVCGATYSTSGTGDFLDANNKDSYTLNIVNYTVGTATKLEFKFRAEDNDGNAAERTITVTVGSGTSNVVAPQAWSGVTLTYDNSKTVTTQTGNFFFSSKTGSTMTLAQAQAAGTDMDIYYFFSASTGHSLVAGASATDAQLGTYMVSGTSGYGSHFKSTGLTKADFDSVSNQAVLTTLYNAGTFTTVNAGQVPVPALPPRMQIPMSPLAKCLPSTRQATSSG